LSVLNVDAPEFIKELNSLLSSESIDSWKSYLRFHVADTSSPYLSSKFVEENFEFYRKYLRGAKEMQPRWKRCVQYVDYDLGEALGQVYVAKVFSPELKQSTLDMVRRIEDAMGARIRARLDESGNQTAGVDQAGGDPQQDWLSRSLARLQLGKNCS
jgi:putative endopeptidase